MTEAEMKTKWCPEMFYIENAPDGRCVQTNVHTKCIGSDCAMWQWEYRRSHAGTTVESLERTRHGFCGKARS